MARIKILDLPKDKKISRAEMKKIRGAMSRNYMLIIDDDGKSYIQFGDGNSGAIPPTGRSNVSATYGK
ncbi:MAG: hypothetical protein JXB48_13805 [Candidatus Latescibacteria bacterium]|nr:hypothetical protein [Candidatus Latescibacterota bacterium]